jgi:hypothetical protein
MSFLKDGGKKYEKGIQNPEFRSQNSGVRIIVYFDSTTFSQAVNLLDSVL